MSGAGGERCSAPGLMWMRVSGVSLWVGEGVGKMQVGTFSPMQGWARLQRARCGVDARGSMQDTGARCGQEAVSTGGRGTDLRTLDILFTEHSAK